MFFGVKALATITALDGVVKTFVGGGLRDVSHPSYQAWSYAALLEGFNEAVYQQDITLKPCAFLHNCEVPGDLISPFYKQYLEKAPLFSKNDVVKLADFIKSHVKYGDPTNIMYRIEHGKIRPSKTIADTIAKMINGHEEIGMIDDQKVVFEYAKNLVDSSSAAKKNVLIVSGGPGTGKSVVAIQLTAGLTAEQKLVQYVSKNSAPRDVYASKLTGYRSKTWVNNLFKGSGSYINTQNGEFDALIVDEAHRLNEKSGMFSNLGENQIKEKEELVIFYHFKKVRAICDATQKPKFDKIVKEAAKMMGPRQHEGPGPPPPPRMGDGQGPPPRR